MNNSMLDISPRSSKQRSSKSSLALSIILIVLGLLAIILPVATSVGVVTILSWLVIFDGLAQLFFAFKTEGVGRFTWKLLVAILYLCGGIYLLIHPLLGLTGLTLLLAIFFFAEGIMDVITYIFTRTSGSSTWLLLHGLATFVLGLMIWRRWPLSSLWMIGILVGISMLVTGLTRLMMVMEVRKLAAAR